MAKSKKASKKKSLAKKVAAKKSAPKKSATSKSSSKSKMTAKPSGARASAKPSRATVGKNALTPLDDRILVSVEGPAETTAGGIIIPGSVTMERPNRGKVIASGRGRRNKKGKVRPLDVGVGDTVLFTDYAGTKVEIEGQELLILREEDVLAIVT